MSTETRPQTAAVAGEKGPPTPLRRQWRLDRLWGSILAGIVAGGLVLVFGGSYVASLQSQWTAEARVLVVPGSDVGRPSIPGYYETLSQGQVVATAAQILGDRRHEAQVARDLGLEEPDSVTAEASVEPGTAVVNVSATAPQERVAERYADRLVTQAQPDLRRLLRPFAVERISSATGSAEESGLSTTQSAAALALAAIVAGVSVQQVAYHVPPAARPGQGWLTSALARRSDRRSA